jgi:hypothetical protein
MVVDLLHEFELGVWKSLFTHLVRILVSVDLTLANEMDRRYDKVSAFIYFGSVLTSVKISTSACVWSRYHQ